jgi:hypothetical protein
MEIKERGVLLFLNIKKFDVSFKTYMPCGVTMLGMDDRCPPKFAL